MPQQAGAALVGDQATQKALTAMGQSAANRVMKPSLRAGAKVVNDAAKRNASPSNFQDSLGGLRRSLGIKTGTAGGRRSAVASERRAATSVYAVVGARIGEGWKLDDNAQPDGIRKPSRYLHLVEKGTKPRQGHPGSRPHPVVEAAFDSNEARVKDAVASRTRVEMDKERERQRKKAERAAARAAARAQARSTR